MLLVECIDPRFPHERTRTFSADGVHDVRDLVIDLPAAASIGGGVVLPEDAVPPRWHVVFETPGRLDRFPHSVRVEETGSYESGPIGAGKWRVTLARGSEPYRRAQDGADDPAQWGLSSSRSFAVGATPVEIELIAGERARLDLDAMRPSALRLRGSLSLVDVLLPVAQQTLVIGCGGPGFEQPDVTLRPIGTLPVDEPGSRAQAISTARLATDGRFEVGVHEPGTFTLELRRGTRGRNSLRIERDLELREPDTSWELELELGRLVVDAGEVPGWEDLRSAQIDWRDGLGTRVKSRLHHQRSSEPGRSRWIGHVPPGHQDLWLYRDEESGWDLYRVFVPRGGETTFVPPPAE